MCKIYDRTKALFATRLLVFLDKFKEDKTAQLIAESIQEAVKTLHPTNGEYGRVQRDNQKIVLDKIKQLIILYMEI